MDKHLEEQLKLAKKHWKKNLFPEAMKVIKENNMVQSKTVGAVWVEKTLLERVRTHIVNKKTIGEYVENLIIKDLKKNEKYLSKVQKI